MPFSVAGFLIFHANAPSYGREENGKTTGVYESILHALESDTWDYVALQQVGLPSPNFNTYMPYLQELAQCVRKLAP